MARPNLITGQILIPTFDQSFAVNPTANVSFGSSNINSISNGSLLYPGLEISNPNFPSGTTVVSINYGANTAVLSNNATGSATGTTLTVVFSDGFYYCSGATFQDVNGVYNNSNITEGFQIVNQATDSFTYNYLIGVFNLWRITHITNRSGDQTTLSFYVTFDEEAPYSSFGHIPTNGNYNAITQQTTFRSYGWNVSSDVYPNLAGGSDVAQSNLDAQNISDFVPIIYGPTGPGITGAWSIGFTGSGISSISSSFANGQETVLIDISGGGSTGGQGSTGATGATGASYITNGSGWTYVTGDTGTTPGDFDVTTSSGSGFSNVTSIYINKIDYNSNDYASLLLYLANLTSSG